MLLFLLLLLLSLSSRLFCKVAEFTRKNLDMLFPSVKKPSAKVLSPSGLDSVGDGDKLSDDADQSWVASKCIFSLLKSLVYCMDIKSVHLRTYIALSPGSLIEETLGTRL